jgi:Fur family ferric uptake transcriptional regulator
MSNPYEKFQSTMRQQGQKVTRARKLVFEALQDKEPQTMHEVVLACPSIDRASVYRVIELFERMGIVQRLQIGWKYKLELSDSFHHHHHHLTCLHCGKTIPLHEDKKLEQQLRDAASAQNFVMQDHQLEIQGLCSNCRPA